MNILNALARLRDDIKTWVTNNINILNSKIDNKLDSGALPGAINDAIAQAKESGELKGERGDDGVSATHSWNGTTLIVTSASGTSSANLKGDKGDKGDTGEAGYTPVRGIDYWTDDDKNEIKQSIDIVIPNGDWNQNDETAVDYIKNRTHYSETTTEESVIVSDLSLEGASFEVDTMILEFYTGIDWSDREYKAGTVVNYEITHKGLTSYFSYVKQDNSWGIEVGEYGIDYLRIIDIGDGTEMTLSLRLLGMSFDPAEDDVANISITVKVIETSETVIQLNEKYIPQSIARKSSVDTLKTEVNTIKTNVSKCVKSVNGKTPNSNGAVNITYAYDDLTDKPFGITQEEGYAPLGVLDGRSFEFANQENIYYVQEIDPTDIYFADGHYITWDGTFYECGEPVYIEADNSYLLGGVDMGEISITNNMPFCLKVTTDVETYEPTSAKIYTRWAGPHTIKVTTWYSDMIDVVKPLDEKFIPDTIARTEDVISLPPYTSADEGKILQIVNGVPTWVSLPNAEEATF